MNVPDAFYTSRVTEALDSLAIHVTSARNIAASLKPIKTAKLELKREERPRAIINSIDPARTHRSKFDEGSGVVEPTTFTIRGKNLTKDSVTGFELFLEDDPSFSFSAVDVEPNDEKKVTEFTGSVDLSTAPLGSYELRITDQNDTPHLPGLIVEVEADESSHKTPDELKTRPKIKIQPSSSVNKNTKVVLTVRANGSDPLSWHWFKDRKAIPGEKNTLTISNAKVSDAGTYSVVVVYRNGLVARAAAKLSVKKTGD
jgi:Immunoglobulin domain